MTDLSSIITGIVSSLIASGTLLLFMSKIRPAVAISRNISKHKSSDGRVAYRIKIINRSKRSLINIRAQLHLITPSNVPEGMISRSKEIPLNRKDPMELAKYDKNDNNADYAFRFLTYENIDSLWINEAQSYLKFRIFAVDAFSGFGKVFTQNYHSKSSDIIEGVFEFGDSTRITQIHTDPTI